MLCFSNAEHLTATGKSVNPGYIARRAGSDGSMSASGLAGPGFNPWRGSKFSFENFQPWG